MTTKTQLPHHHRRYHKNICNIFPKSSKIGTNPSISEVIIQEEQIREMEDTYSLIGDTFTSLDNEDVEEEIQNNIMTYPLRKKDLLFNSKKYNNYFLEEIAGLGNI